MYLTKTYLWMSQSGRGCRVRPLRNLVETGILISWRYLAEAVSAIKMI